MFASTSSTAHARRNTLCGGVALFLSASMIMFALWARSNTTGAVSDVGLRRGVNVAAMNGYQSETGACVWSYFAGAEDEEGVPGTREGLMRMEIGAAAVDAYSKDCGERCLQDKACMAFSTGPSQEKCMHFNEPVHGDGESGGVCQVKIWNIDPATGQTKTSEIEAAHPDVYGRRYFPHPNEAQRVAAYSPKLVYVDSDKVGVSISDSVRKTLSVLYAKDQTGSIRAYREFPADDTSTAGTLIVDDIPAAATEITAFALYTGDGGELWHSSEAMNLANEAAAADALKAANGTVTDAKTHPHLAAASVPILTIEESAGAAVISVLHSMTQDDRVSAVYARDQNGVVIFYRSFGADASEARAEFFLCCTGATKLTPYSVIHGTVEGVWAGDEVSVSPSALVSNEEGPCACPFDPPPPPSAAPTVHSDIAEDNSWFEDTSTDDDDDDKTASGSTQRL